MITVCTPLEPRTIAKIADSAMALSRKKPCFFVKIGTRSLGQCWITTHIAATRMIARSAPSPSSPAPSARRYAALGLDRSARPSKGDTMPQNACRTMLASIEDTRSSDNVRQVECWFPHLIWATAALSTACPAIEPRHALGTGAGALSFQLVFLHYQRPVAQPELSPVRSCSSTITAPCRRSANLVEEHLTAGLEGPSFISRTVQRRRTP